VRDLLNEKKQEVFRLLKTKKWYIIGLTLILTIFFHNVDKNITNEDEVYIKLFLENCDDCVKKGSTYEEEIRQIIKIDSIVISKIVHDSSIPMGQTREPKDVYLAGHGYCYDRSRVLEKIFIYLGYEVRHVSLFQKNPDQNTILTLLSKELNSHSVSEVKTKKGWVIVGSNKNWVSVDTNNQPYSMKQLCKKLQSGQKVDWKITLPSEYDKFYIEECHFIYGVFDRHGKFYPPYTPIPDYNIGELFHNVLND
jgi:hypothetical protein